MVIRLFNVETYSTNNIECFYMPHFISFRKLDGKMLSHNKDRVKWPI